MPDDINSDSPCETLVLSERPTFRWNEVPGASSYLVSLMDGSKICWQQKVRGTEVVYSGNAPLEQGVFYSLEIKSVNDFSSKSALGKPDLNVLSEDRSNKAGELENASDAIETNLLEQDVMLKVQTAVHTTVEQTVVNFFSCPSGPCYTVDGQPGIWTSSRSGRCFCSPNVGG